MKRCRVCGELLPLDSFHRNPKSVDGLQGACKPCRVKLRHETKRRKQLLLTPEELYTRPLEHVFEQMLEEHQGPLLGRIWGVAPRCAIEIASNPWKVRLKENDPYCGEYMLNHLKERQLIEYLERQVNAAA